MMSNDEYLTNPCSHGETGVCIQCIQEDPDLDQIPGRIGNENPGTTDEQESAQEIRELALREIPPVLAGRMDLAHYFLKRDDGIDLMVRRDGSSATSVTKNSDLSITIRSEIRVPRRLRQPGLRIHWDHETFWQNHAELMIQELPGAREAPEFSERPFMPGIGAGTSADVVEIAIAQSLGIDEEDLEDLGHRYFQEITELVDPNLAMRAELLGMSESDPFHPEPVPGCGRRDILHHAEPVQRPGPVRAGHHRNHGADEERGPDLVAPGPQATGGDPRTRGLPEKWRGSSGRNSDSGEPSGRSS